MSRNSNNKSIFWSILALKKLTKREARSNIAHIGTHCLLIVVYKRLYGFLQNRLYQRQYGFRAKHSTINAITDLYIDVLKSIDLKEQTLALYLDLSKEFDTINHKILLDTLEIYGIRGTLLNWFKNYLTNRRQFIQFDSSSSKMTNIICGVPQG